MKIAVSAIGRFHMFDLARQMLRLGQEVQIFTGNPMCRVDRELRPFTRTHSLLHVVAALRQRMPPAPRTTWWQNLDYISQGSWLARSIDPDTTDVLDSLDGLGPAAGRLMKRYSKAWICNRGSAHILTQKAILEEEHRRWSVTAPYFSEVGLDRCLQEYAEADAIVVPSQFARRSFLDHGIATARVFVCPYGVDLSEFHPGTKPDNVFRVLFVGGTSIQKGIGHLLAAVEPLVNRRQCELWLVGPIDAAARHILDRYRDSFKHRGIYPRRDLWQIYSQASVLVMPSVQEGFGLVQAQAMACGVPVIGSRNSGAEDLFTDGVEGFIVPAADSGAIQSKIEWMIANPVQRAEMATAALNRVRSLGGWDRYGDSCLAMYNTVVTRRGAPAVRVPHRAGVDQNSDAVDSTATLSAGGAA